MRRPTKSSWQNERPQSLVYCIRISEFAKLEDFNHSAAASIISASAIKLCHPANAYICRIDAVQCKPVYVRFERHANRIILCSAAFFDDIAIEVNYFEDL